MIAVGIEGWSVRENLRAAHSSAAKIADIVAKIAGTQDIKEVLRLLNSLDQARSSKLLSGHYKAHDDGAALTKNELSYGNEERTD